MTLIQPDQPVTLAAGDPAQSALSLELSWEKDRFVQRISFIREDQSVPLFQSVDVSAPGGDRWPLSPPVQQASIEEVGGRRAILGVGAAGTSHWSISIEAMDQEGPSLRFDYACRCSKTPGHLGSRYQWDKPLKSQTDAFAGILFPLNDGYVQIAPEDCSSIATCSNESRWWEIVPERTPNEEKGQESCTIRWSYQVQIL